MNENTKKRALRMLEKRDYGRDELVSKLTEKGEDAADAAEVADRMAEVGFINDEKYAAMVVRHYAAKGFGAARVREELRRRRLPREYWDAALEQLSGQEETAYALLCSKLRGREADRDSVRKASDALRRRGFSWEEVRSAAERYAAERNIEE